MASMSETSYWINFFTSSGIPAGDATHYAIIFCDNRITRDMLLDLSKEYLTDMGISRLGDVIAILKHAKEVYNQEARDKVMKSTAFSLESPSQSAYSPSPRRSTGTFISFSQLRSLFFIIQAKQPTSQENIHSF
ncbi:actin cytoskeleton-regulatory complex protein SLA1 [Elysia marginata]|uniref:Actin cytoskeleton-regulatory complex protein SLA1 n=1 Tax=Elysia marginata TaxID=1093978 RepID=A0AAV4IY09_9GAST|nr:actin cytoskeleton-regulatory complex protein SLA1 [Elysia marginata]